MAHHWPLPSPPSHTTLLIVTSIFCLTSLTSVTLRFYARKLARLDLCADDWFALAALILTLTYNATLLSGTSHDIIANYTPTHLTSTTTPEAKKYQLALQLLEILSLGLIKLCFFTLWKRVFITHPIRHLCSILIITILLWMIAFLLATIFQCGTHVSRIWMDADPTTTASCTNGGTTQLTIYALTDLITNILITLIPVPIIWSLRMYVVKKVGMVVLYGVGIYLTAISIARTYMTLIIIHTTTNRPFMENFGVLVLWAAIEINVGVVVCCVTVVLRGVREVRAEKRKKEFHVLSGVGPKKYVVRGVGGRDKDGDGDGDD
ncbi:uncharacterized protein BO80DRAFT_497545 [Aspergillus ibericus CBS 121593]|uniref:Rhodopsin domain-containing protein n=1 Tax=Aspergillus ibericus CBS 121593 TaxID=1448316 RepID=A0A395GNZ7_9EURO|nr:hypothetical protein BO80DRAFT_497545 [Aspergillus ibericus CBS 121593]RAK95743.1 hypothetical protein BO80DRAFT_497545 [Aspergillus ibericus CBS 121593]